MPTMKRNSAFNRPVVWLIAGALLLGCGWVWRLCQYDSGYPFLPRLGPAEWIVYPKPPDATPHNATPFWAVFRRSFKLEALPPAATLSVRAFKQGAVHINGRPVDKLPLREQDWKARHTIEVSQFLRAGENEISVTVSNSLGPPALWLSLEAGALALHSGPDWQVSLVGAAWQKAALASEPPAIRPGNPLFGREQMAASLRRAGPALLLILLFSVAVIGSGWIMRRRSAGHAASPGGDPLARAPLAVLGVIIVAYAVLFANNLPQLASLLGFDRDGHQQYMDYILQNKALPLADDGWQMYQPPLFYLISALIIGSLGWPATADSAILTLRAFSALTGIAHLVVVFLCLRLLFPGRPRQQVVGLLFAGFLGMNLCLSHHITNESLAALFVTGALYFCLRLLRTETGAGNLAIATGACMGLALLTKFSAVLVVPLILVALAWNLLKSKAHSPKSTVAWCRTEGHLALVVAACLAVCGWHFARVWHRFGTPLIGNWDPRLPFAWWQDPGYHTCEWYRSFGQAFVTPLFSSISGFADGVYATFWGDGLCSGSAMMNFRPQWNYDLMNAGYLLSLLGTALLIAGLCVALIRFIRQPTPEWFLLLGLVFAFAVGVALMSLRVASYAQVKAFYALPALLPLCAMAALGWDFLSGKSATLRLGLQVGVLAWATTVYLAFWIRPGNAFTHTTRGVGFADDGRFAEAADSFTQALALDPQALTARVGLAEAWRHLGRAEEARQQADLALQQHPREAEALMESAAMLGLERRYDEAVRHSMQAISEAPDHPGAYQQLAACLALAGQQRQVVETCEKGLRVTPFNPTLHHSLAVAAAETGDLTNAMTHLRLALALKPKWPEARSFLALTLDSIGRHEEAAAEYEQAIKDKPDDARLRYLYAMTLAMQGKAIEAAGHYRQVLDLQPDNVEAMNNLAWILAANPDAQARNGGEAVRLAERACELTRQREPVLLGTLAAAYAEAGRFPNAAAAAEKARALATAAGQKEVADKNSELLELYRAGKPYREPGAGTR